MTEYCPYIKYRRRPAVVPRSPSGRLGCGGRPPPTFAPCPARCRAVAADRRSALGVWPRRPRRSRGAGARPPACPVAAFRPLAGFCGTRRARGRRVPRSVPRALFGFPAPLRRLVKPASPRQPGGGFAAGLGVPSPFLPRAGGGRLCPRSSLCSRLRLRAKPLCPSGRRLRRRACPPLRRSLRSARPSGSLWVGSVRLRLPLASARGVAAVARACRGEPPSSRGSPLAALAPRCARLARCGGLRRLPRWPRASLRAAAGGGACYGAFGARLFPRAPPAGIREPYAPLRRRWRKSAALFARRRSTGGLASPFPLSLKEKKLARGSRYTNSAKPQGDINTYLTLPKLNKKFFYFV